MKINFLKTDGYKFDVSSKSFNRTKALEGESIDIDEKEFTLKQRSDPEPSGALGWILYFLKMFAGSVVRAFILLRRKIKQEESPVFMEAQFEITKDHEEAFIYFEKSDFSPYNHLLTKPHFSLDPALRIKNVFYFVDMPTVLTNKRKQLLRSLSNFAMLSFLDTLFLIYTIIEELPVASTLAVFFYLPIIAGLIISIVRCAKKYKVYLRELNSEVAYLNDHSKERSSDAGKRV